ncbi:hypothetical protein [Acaryochloris marina]|uniref:Uncharacterized protein n=1 Tax=Acaryochloris marina (strain MBIC 11017) TaxID=329726 RepID=A8ZKB9_ACAM1|nr:hypothetical protein [Acaryochloris marina]ABW31619.1 hypothetical protein AM1_A0110 [Acaryochloris marina MBIC11017]BDM83693.1 hypothetical protein AM10699_65540 [Acaryochloris marina MBIC10699]
MFADDITDYYFEHSQPTLTASNTVSLNVPIIEFWRCYDISNNVIIRGQIFNHPKYPAGKSLKSSPIQGCLTKAGRVYVTTKNSMYELGTPHPKSAGDALNWPNHTDHQPLEKLTYWGE